MSIYSDSFDETIFSDPNTSLSKLFSLIPKSTSSILDIGCSGGYLGKYIKSKYPQTIVDGVEIDKSDAKIASKFLNHVYNIDIQQSHLVAKLPNKYDVMIFADILEHTADPESVLLNFTKKLSSKGQVIISVPNIVHQSIILELIAGQWNYELSGILDRTHLQYFDYNRVVNLIENNNLYIKKIDFTIFDLPTSSIIKNLKIYHFPATSDTVKFLKKPQYKIFQYVVSATKVKPISYKSFKTKKDSFSPIDSWINEWELAVNKWELAVKEYNSKIKKIEDELSQIKNSKFYLLWPWYNRLKHLIKK